MCMESNAPSKSSCIHFKNPPTDERDPIKKLDIDYKK